MSKERLEEIKKTQYQIIEVSKTNMQEDFNYLLSYISNLEMAFDDLDSDYIDLSEQNKRYQDLLKAITGLMETDAEIYLTDKARLNGIHDELVEFYKEDSK